MCAASSSCFPSAEYKGGLGLSARLTATSCRSAGGEAAGISCAGFRAVSCQAGARVATRSTWKLCLCSMCSVPADFWGCQLERRAVQVHEWRRGLAGCSRAQMAVVKQPPAGTGWAGEGLPPPPQPDQSTCGREKQLSGVGVMHREGSVRGQTALGHTCVLREQCFGRTHLGSLVKFFQHILRCTFGWFLTTDFRNPGFHSGSLKHSLYSCLGWRNL